MLVRTRKRIPGYRLIYGDCQKKLSLLKDCSVDAVVTDPPYGLKFMGHKWDYNVPSIEIWQEILRVLKPGGHVVSFGGSRTYHRMVVAVEDAGFEIRDQIMWLYGSGFPKSLNISKAIDKASGAKREIIGRRIRLGDKSDYPAHGTSIFTGGDTGNVTANTTDAAKRWDGWGTALKPAHEPICVARKPFAGTVIGNVMAYGTGAINVGGCQIEGEPWQRDNTHGRAEMYDGWGMKPSIKVNETGGRWPANVCHDGSNEVLAGFPETTSGARREGTPKVQGVFKSGLKFGTSCEASSGSAARFFYCAKASKSDRGNGNIHSTVKPTNLMRWLVRLVCAPGGTVLDPFMGSGSTGKACALENMSFIGIEQDEESFCTARQRVMLAYETR